MLNESSRVQPSGWAELPPVAAEITSPMLVVDAFDDASPRTLDSIPPVGESEIIPFEVAKVLAQDAKGWSARAANVQGTAFCVSAIDTLIWMSMNVYSFLESPSPEEEVSHISHGLHTTASIGMIICGTVMMFTAVAAAKYRSEGWSIRQRLKSATILRETKEA